ncbi:hypothetical protein [Corynebacterium mastitidis]|uniref:hypothetical protein n=1 Tax=Corynebacterium mastitidis TaxID=161890 RepID=UPI00254CB84E|nr:hypothetical protein [Corynebacterium mastitidis]MDK8451133.1 hypothetical protein [Corynebacterium mastitidis]
MRTRLARLFNLAWLIAVALPSFGTAREVMDKQYYSLAPALGGLLMAAVIATLWAVRTVFSTRPDRFVTRTFLVFAPSTRLRSPSTSVAGSGSPFCSGSPWRSCCW